MRKILVNITFIDFFILSLIVKQSPRSSGKYYIRKQIQGKKRNQIPRPTETEQVQHATHINPENYVIPRKSIIDQKKRVHVY